ncbi:MAG TPA: DivIVA domain-containing protein [Acidimicrobiia bacterium]|nr:DivIVA domain-containing protein [Acidimicrobiia bacterium]
MEITPRELRDIEIHSEIRGYSRDEVNDLLERAAIAIEAANQRVSQLQDRLTSAQGEAVRTRETEDILHRTLLLAQRAADEAVAEATAKSRQMLDEAEMSSRRLVADAEAEARRKGETERRRLEEEIVELAGRRDTLLADVEALTRFEAEYRERMVRALESDLTSLRTRPTTAPGSKPETADVEVPSADTSSAEADASADAPAEPPSATANGTGSDAAGNGQNGSGVYTPSPSAGGANASPTDAPPSQETSEVDVRALFDQVPGPAGENDAPASDRAPADTAASAPASGRAGLQPLDLGDPDALDADILDDDAFFATLRDAVHDEAPLGPREEGDDITGENRFFDQDADRGSFRDVFRRRR